MTCKPATAYVDARVQGTLSSNEESYKWLAEDSAKAKVTVSPMGLPCCAYKVAATI